MKKKVARVRRNAPEAVPHFCADCEKLLKPGETVKQPDGRTVCASCAKKAKAKAAARRQMGFFGAQGSQGELFEPNPAKGPRRLRNVEMGFRDEYGTFHPIRASKDYNEFRTTDVMSAAERKEHHQAQKYLARRKGEKRVSREEREREEREEQKRAGKQRKSLAQFVRRKGGMNVHPKDPFKGELDRLRRRESRTTGLFSKHNYQGSQRFSPEYMMDAANQEGFRDRDGQPFEAIGDFLDALEMDATGRHKIYPYENPATARRAPKGQAGLFDMYPVQVSEPAMRIARVREVDTGEEGTALQEKNGFFKVKWDGRAKHTWIRPEMIRFLNRPPSGARQPNPLPPVIEFAMLAPGAVVGVLEAHRRLAAAGDAGERKGKRKKNPVQVIGVTPAVARKWLKVNRNNRAVDDARVGAISKLMREGKYHDRQGLTFTGGKLRDGQHRLLAVIKSGETVMFNIHGVPATVNNPAWRKTVKPAPANVRKIHKEFLDRETERYRSYLTPAGTPADVAALGKLVAVGLTRRRKIDFRSPAAMLGARGDQKRRMYIGLSQPYVMPAGAKPGKEFDLGEIVWIDYKAVKPHLHDNREHTFRHKMGEEGGRRPHLTVQDGLLRIRYGDYEIRPEGIRN